MHALRTFAIWSLMAVGLVLTFAGFFALMGALYLFLGTAASLVFFVSVSATVVAGLSALFINDRVEEEEDPYIFAAPEGLNVVRLRGRVS